jgi:hypothetical protein
VSLNRISYDWLSLFIPIQKVTLGTKGGDLLAATKEGELVLSLGGDDKITSTVN